MTTRCIHDWRWLGPTEQDWECWRCNKTWRKEDVEMEEVVAATDALRAVMGGLTREWNADSLASGLLARGYVIRRMGNGRQQPPTTAGLTAEDKRLLQEAVDRSTQQMLERLRSEEAARQTHVDG